MALPILDELVPGIQLAVFEIVWPAHPNLDRILFRVDDHMLDVYFQWRSAPTEVDRESSERLMQETIDVAFDGKAPSIRFVSEAAPPSEQYHELMSEPIFKSIASAVAPWRLKAGR